jgi:hypothetical protein
MLRYHKIHIKSALLFFLALGSTVVLQITSCTGPEADFQDQLAFVTSVSLPDTVQIGVSFLVSISTFTPSSAWQQGHDEVQEIEDGYRIVPYDIQPLGRPLVGDVGGYIHEVPLTLYAAGTSEIQIAHHLSNPVGGNTTGTIVRHVVVQAGSVNKTD